MVPFDDKGFCEAMSHEVRDWLSLHVKEERFKSFDGREIQTYYALRDHAKASIVMVHGFCEFFGRYHEVAYNFYEAGYNIFFIEQRGHGHSERVVEEYLVHVDDFSEYVEDLKCMLEQVVIPKVGDGLKLLYCHSMGGAVGTLFLERHPEYFAGAVLSSPMLKMSYGQVKDWQADVLQKVSKALKWRTRGMPGAEPFDPDKPDFEGCGMTSKARFDYQFALRRDSDRTCTTNSGTYGWIRAAMQASEEARAKAGVIKIPVLILQAGLDDMVDNEGQDEVKKKIRHCELRHFPESKHEIFGGNEAVLKKYYKVIFRFFDMRCAEHDEA